MGFESGSVSCRVFYVPKGIPEDSLERFAQKTAPSLETLREDPVSGWVTGRHLLDRNINEDTAYYAGYLRLTLMQAERKVPDALLRAECALEEMARLQASGLEYLKREEKIQIRKEIKERLLPDMPPQLRGIPMVYDEQEGLMYTGALSDKQHDAFQLHFRDALGFNLPTLNPKTAALKRLQVNVDDLGRVSFSPEAPDEAVSDSIGQDFLTWLWYKSESGGGAFDLGAIGRFGVAVEGPLTFVMEGSGAHETVLRKGSPVVSAEAKTALLSGKKLKRAKLTIARSDEVWTCTLDADDFVFRSLKLPEGEKLEPVSRFQARIMALNTFVRAYLFLYDRFLEERSQAGRWEQEESRIFNWVANRTAKY